MVGHLLELLLQNKVIKHSLDVYILQNFTISCRIVSFWECMFLASTVWNVSKYGVFSGPYFSTFGLNTERYFVSLCVQFACGKIRTRKNSVFWTLFTQWRYSGKVHIKNVKTVPGTKTFNLFFIFLVVSSILMYL